MGCELRPTGFPTRATARWRRMTRIVWHALPIVVMLAAMPTAAFARSLVCDAIRRGESAAQVARRITGDARNAYRASFQIMNASSRFVPKSQYDRVRAGWRACVFKPVIERTSSAASRIKAPDALESDAPDETAAPGALVAASEVANAERGGSAGQDLQLPASNVVRTTGSVDLTMVWLGAAMVLPWFGWRILDDYLARRKTMSIVVRHFADRFVAEFERPLVRENRAERPVRSRLRCSARQGRFDILLAPGDGKRYPNLLDHKKNVEYDVDRVMQAIADESFVSGPLYTQAGWVVVPFEFHVRRNHGGGGKAGPKQTGVTCISSL